MDEEAALKAEIARLSGAIQTHKHHSSYPPSTRGRASFRGSYRGSRGAYPANAVPQRNRTLILNDTSKPTTSQPASAAPTSEKASAEGWVKRKSTHNLSLLSTSTFEKTEPARLAALAATQKARAAAITNAAPSKATSSAAYKGKGKPASSSVRRGDNMGEVVIDGVVFEFDPSGTKLIKKASQPSSARPESSATASREDASASTVPLKTHVNGQNYVRTKRGNLISAELLAKRRAQRESVAKMQRLNNMVGQISDIQATRNTAARGSNMSTSKANKAKMLCTFFNKTGQCKRGLSCPYIHDITKIALCPKLLRPSGCTLPKGTCPLSHTPKPQRVPHCVHYLRTGDCRNGIACIYTHSDKLPNGLDTKICRDFSNYGWCERGENCTERHTYECPDFVEKGKCDRKGCKLLHVIRANPNGDASTQRAETDLDSMQDGDLFMRDDAAAQLTDEEESEQPENAAKRKRPLINSTLDNTEAGSDVDGDEDDLDTGISFVQNGGGKRKKAKAFIQQNDFISFDDAEDDLDTLADEDEHDQQLADSDDEESVHSEEFNTDDDADSADDDGSDNDRVDRDL